MLNCALIHIRPAPERQMGGTLLEVLITVIILAFGLLGLAGLQGKIQVAESESYQRAQAILLVSDMAERISVNGVNAANYITNTPLGTGDSQPATCDALAAGMARDQCEWSNALKGAAEKSGSSNVGAMLGARGCVTQLQAADPTNSICTPGIYQVAVVWQGLNRTATPSLACGQGLYGEETYRRAIAKQVIIGLPSCTYP